MNRSITRKALLVIVLVTLIGAGGLAQSGTSTPVPTNTETSKPITGWANLSNSIGNYRHPANGGQCPLHHSAASKNPPAYAHSAE